MGARDIVRREMAALTEREQREAPQEHLVVDPVTGEESTTALTPDVVADIEGGRRQLGPSASVRVQLPDGAIHRVSGTDAQAAIARGARLLDVREERRAAHETTLEEAYGDRPVLAAIQGAARGATLGLSDLLARGMGYEEAVAEVAKRSPSAALAGEIIGAAAPALISGGSSTGAQVAARTPAGLAARAGEAIAAKGAGKGLLARTTARVAGGGVEGTIFGAGTGVTELALSDEPVTMERAVSVMSSRALYGGAIGGGIGGTVSLAGAAADKGLRAGRKLLADAGDRLAGAPSKGADVVEAITGYHGARSESGVFLLAKGEAKAEISGAAGKMRDALGAPTTLGKRPGRMLELLEREEKQMATLLDEGREATLRRLGNSDIDVRNGLRDLLDEAADKPKILLSAKGKQGRPALAPEYRDFAGLRGKGALRIKVEDARRFLAALDAGEMTAARTSALDKLPALLERNRALTQTIEAATAKAERGIGSALEGYATRATLGHIAIGGPFGAVVGALAPKLLDKLKDVVAGRLAKGAAAAAQRGQSAIDALLATGQKVASRAPPLATQVLTRVAYAPEGARSPLSRASVPSGVKLVEAYRERERELRAQTTMAPDGSIVMRPGARAALAQQLSPLAVAASPLHADRAETAGARRIEFLASKLPKRPDMTTIGPDRWRPSDLEIRGFARYAAAAEDPYSVLERLAEGTVTPEDAETLRAVYPEIYQQARNEIMGRLPELRESLPYARRLALSIFFDAPVDPSMDPRVLRVLQNHFEQEPAQAGGLPPAPAPQFSALKRTEPATRAQQLSQPRGSA